MSEIPTEVVNCQKPDLTPGRNQKIQIPPQNPFSPGTLESDFPPPRQNPLENPDFSPKFWGEMTLCSCTQKQVVAFHVKMLISDTSQVADFCEELLILLFPQIFYQGFS